LASLRTAAVRVTLYSTIKSQQYDCSVIIDWSEEVTTGALKTTDLGGHNSKDPTTKCLWLTIAIHPLHWYRATVFELHLAYQTSCVLVRLSETKTGHQCVLDGEIYLRTTVNKDLAI